MRNIFSSTFFILLLQLLLFIGWIQSVYKFVSCDFKASYKAEVIYGVGAVTGLGGIVGWFNFGK